MRILALIGSRVLYLTLSVLLTVSLVFVVVRLIPGDPAALRGGIGSSEQSRIAFQERYNLDRPLGVQYWGYLGRVVRLDFGTSFFNARPVRRLIAERMPLTLTITVLSFALSLLLALPLSVLAVLKRGKAIAGLINAVDRIVLSIPEFWLGLLMLLFFAVWIPIFPLFGYQRPIHLVLPIAVLGINRGAAMLYVLREAVAAERRKQYIVAAQLRGISRWRLGTRWLVRNAVPSILPIAGLQLGYLFGGAIIIEQLFALPGFGRLMIGALLARDYPIIEGGSACVALLFGVTGVAVDLVHRLIDPRLRSKEKIAGLI